MNHNNRNYEKRKSMKKAIAVIDKSILVLAVTGIVSWMVFIAFRIADQL